MRIFAIDPGATQSAFAIWSGTELLDCMIIPNADMLHICVCQSYIVAIEMVCSYGMAVGREVFDTCVWIGRFQQNFMVRGVPKENIRLVPRMDVKMHLCHTSRAKDSNIRQSLVDRFGEPGTKKNPGILYGVKSHIWPALALAVTVADKEAARIPAAENFGDMASTELDNRCLEDVKCSK